MAAMLMNVYVESITEGDEWTPRPSKTNPNPSPKRTAERDIRIGDSAGEPLPIRCAGRNAVRALSVLTEGEQTKMLLNVSIEAV